MWKMLIATPEDRTALLLRLALALVIFPHGAQKLLGWFGGAGFAGTMGFFTQTISVPAGLALLVVVVEFFGPLGLLVGLLSRVAAFGIACIMAVATLVVHRPHGFFMNWYGSQQGEGFEYHLLVFAIALAVMITGSGAVSLDRRLATGTRPARSPRPFDLARQDTQIEEN